MTGFYDDRPYVAGPLTAAMAAAQGPVSVPEAYPAPEISSRDNVLPVEKQAVLDLQAFAAERGWVSIVQYARGCAPHAKLGTPLPVRSSLGVKLQNGGRFALAVYREGASAWTWDTLYVDGKRCETITQLKELL